MNDLSNASESDVLKQWEGLGYYRRARYLLEAARFIVDTYDGKFPNKYADVLALKGVGEYTASAIVSFAYGQRHIAIDSNVERVIARYFGIPEVKSSLRLKKEVKTILQPQIEQTNAPGQFNQMMIDFGALVCSAKSPDCIKCPIHQTCYAFNANAVLSYPKALIKKKRKRRYFHYLIVIDQGNIGLQLRGGEDIWAGMHEFLLIETSSNTKLTQKAIMNYLCATNLQIEMVDKEYKQLLTHREIYGHFYFVSGQNLKQTQIASQWESIETLEGYAFPGIIRLFLEENMHNFNL